MVLTTPIQMHAYSAQKMYMHPCMRTHAPAQKFLCHGSYCELILSLARASCRLSFQVAARPAAAVSTKSVARRCSLKKSVQIHASSCAVGLYYKIPLSSPLAPHIHTNIYKTLLPLASAQAVLMGKTHSYNGRALGVPVHCAVRCMISVISPRLLLLLLTAVSCLCCPKYGCAHKTKAFFWTV